jgi:hypothetical protein
MSEGNVYLCSWKKAGSDFELRLIDNIHKVIKGSDFEYLDECMKDEILSIYGDGEAIIEYVPPRTEDKMQGSYLYSQLCYGDSNRVVSRDNLFIGGYCEVCEYPIGERSDVLLSLQKKPKTPIISIKGLLPHQMIYHKDVVVIFENLLSEKLTKNVVLFKDKKTDYFEVFPQRIVNISGVVGGTYPSKFGQSWECSLCQRKEFTVHSEEHDSGTLFINPEVLLGKLSNLIFIKGGKATYPAIKTDVWKNHVKNKEFKGVSSSPVCVLNPEFVEEPVLPITSEFDWML